MRNSFIKELCKLNRAHENIILVVGDLGFSVVEPFLDEFPIILSMQVLLSRT